MRLDPKALELWNAAKRPSAPALLNVKGDAADLNLYGVVGQDFTDASVADALASAAKAKSLRLYVNSPGGDFFQGKAIHSQIARYAEGHEVVATVDSLAASAASLLLMAAPRVELAPHATLMIHRTQGMAFGHATDLEDMAKLMRQEDGTLAGLYAKRTGLSVERVADMLTATTWMTAQDAVDQGFADAIAGKDEEEEPEAPAAPANLVAEAGVKLNGAGASHAGSLIEAGKIKDSSSWSAPSADAENAYIEKHGIAEFGRWHLGVHEGTDPSTKAHYAFPFSSDFEHVDYAGLRACVSRAGQAGYQEIEECASALYERAGHKLGKDTKNSAERDQALRRAILSVARALTGNALPPSAVK